MVEVRRVRVAFAATIAVIGITLTIVPPPVFGAQIVQPSGSSIVAALDPAGVPVNVTVVASGFAAGSLVYVEQCDGIEATTQSWSPTVHCDLGSSPAPAIADAHGIATFSSTDRNRAFRPFLGESPQSLFNCLAPSQPAPANSLPNFSNCKLRVSTSNTAVTPDQAFVPIILTTTRRPSPTTVRLPATTGTTAVAKKHSAAGAATGSSGPRSRGATGQGRRTSADIQSVSIAAGQGSSVGFLSLSDPNLVTGYILVFGGVLIAGLAAALRRRRPTPRYRMTGTQTVGER